LAIAEQIQRRKPEAAVHIACSDRPIDRSVLEEREIDFTPIPMRPMPRKLNDWPSFMMDYLSSRRTVRRLLRRMDVRCVVSTGGFVSGPVLLAAHRVGLPIVLLNLDAVPGKANRMLARRASMVFSVYLADDLEADNIHHIPMPLPTQSIGPTDRNRARRSLGFIPEKPLLLIGGGSQGASTINDMMVELLECQPVCQALADWQIMHLAGVEQAEDLQQAYLMHRLDATVTPFTDRMGLAWAAADLAINRAGAGTVAEVTANATPTIFMPYPHHEDDHQRLNAQPLIDAGGALLMVDRKDAAANAKQMAEPLVRLLGNPAHRQVMRDNLRRLYRGNGAVDVAVAVLKQIQDA
jgi:UDP-N-acetylglucosamine--N-acetylmuramyl-(pentapeptide) pyrophosphoryl-undecaprenol N-acetylglucosamine transferase